MKPAMRGRGAAEEAMGAMLRTEARISWLPGGLEVGHAGSLVARDWDCRLLGSWV